ncbi:OpgC family protein [Pseudaestuariivita sp.]|uniref:OpgC family protein n=1 Tax=Pseudaestuariivita sp. TaxID=2211669 RepID=UPI0040590BEB
MTSAPSATPDTPAAKVRDIRLDFFRGIAMFIILLAHTPGNLWTRWIPARWGWSDATEMFVFCSGMASALAFGKLFQSRGLGLGTLRISFRIWQVYWAHIGLFLVTLGTMLALGVLGFELRDYVGQLNLYPFLRNPEGNVIGLLTLTYVPNYFDILPMYLAILAMIPLVMALARIDLRLVALFVGLLWLAANLEIAELWQGDGITPLQLPAQLWFPEGSDTRPWFFNPFGWQLCFFTGFALMMGWLPTPPVTRTLIAIAAAYVLWSFFFSSVGLRNFAWLPEWWEPIRDTLRGWRRDMGVLAHKTDFGILRYLHMLALGYLAWVLVGPGGARLNAAVLQPVMRLIVKVGQQSLAVFVFSMLLARLLGVWLDETSVIEGRRFIRDPWINAGVNLVGFAMIIGCAYLAGFYKSQPWKKR